MYEKEGKEHSTDSCLTLTPTVSYCLVPYTLNLHILRNRTRMHYHNVLLPEAEREYIQEDEALSLKDLEEHLESLRSIFASVASAFKTAAEEKEDVYDTIDRNRKDVTELQQLITRCTKKLDIHHKNMQYMTDVSPTLIASRENISTYILHTPSGESPNSLCQYFHGHFQFQEDAARGTAALAK